MFNLLYFLESNEDYQKLVGFSDIDRDIYGITYLVFSEEVSSNDGRVFQPFNNILVAVNFTTHYLDLAELTTKMVEYGLKSGQLVNYYYLAFDLDEVDDEKVKRIITEKELVTLLNNLNFQFVDNSLLRMSNSGNKVEELKKRLGVP